MLNIFRKKKVTNVEELIEFGLHNGKIHTIKNNNSFQTRGESTIKMVMDALKLKPIGYTGTFNIHTGDFPQEKPKANNYYYSCNTSDSLDHTIPDFVFDAWPQAGIHDYETQTKEIAQHGELPFQNSKLLWIGNSRTHPIRIKFLEIASRNGNLIDGFDTCVDKYVVHKENVKYISLKDHTAYKYLIDLEGRGYSGRLKLLLFSRRLLFIQERSWKEYYHFDLKPYIHFIPVKNDLSDLVEQINFVESQGKEYYNTIASNAYLYAQEQLTYNKALNRLADLLSGTLSNNKI